MSSSNQDDLSALQSAMSGSRSWMMATGMIMIIAGAVAIIFPMISSFGVVICIAILLVFAGIAQIIHAFSYPKWGRLLLTLLVGVVWLVAGIALFGKTNRRHVRPHLNGRGSFSRRRHIESDIYRK